MVMPTIRYWSNVSSETLPLEMMLYGERDGLGVLQVRSNQGQDGGAVVGMFRAQVAQKQLDSIYAIMRSTAFRSLPLPEGLAPGEGVRSLTLVEPKQVAVEKHAVVDQPTLGPFQEAEALSLQLVAELRKKPVQVISLPEVDIPKQVAQGKAVQLTCILANPGSEAVALPAPSTWKASNTMLMVVAVRSDVPPTQITPQHQHFEAVAGDEVIQVSIPPTDGRMIIPPGQQLKLSFKKSINWPPGMYIVHLALRTTMTDATGRGVERYELFSHPVPVQCAGGTGGEGGRAASDPQSEKAEEPPQFVLDA